MVTFTARAEPGDSKHDAADQLSDHQVESINPAEQAQRLDASVYNGYAELLAGQAGTAGMQAVPAPSLGNPAGGALEPQHFAYIIQWYLFALLALAAPVVMARSESKQRPSEDFDVSRATAAPPPPDQAVPTEPTSVPTPAAGAHTRGAARGQAGRPLRAPGAPLTVVQRSLIAARHASGSRASPGPLSSLNRMTPVLSTRKVPRLAKPAISLNTP